MKQNTYGSIWVNSVSDVQSASNFGMQALQEHFTIVCLNDDKELVPIASIDAYKLAEMVMDASPYLILIPKL